MLKEAGRPHPHEEKSDDRSVLRNSRRSQNRTTRACSRSRRRQLLGISARSSSRPPVFALSPSLTRLLVNLLAFNTMSSSPSARAASCASTDWYRGVIRRGVGSGQDGADAAHQTLEAHCQFAPGTEPPESAIARQHMNGCCRCSAWRDDRPLPSPGDGIVTAQTRAQKSQSLARACTHTSASHVGFRANRTLSRQRRMTGYDPWVQPIDATPSNLA